MVLHEAFLGSDRRFLWWRLPLLTLALTRVLYNSDTVARALLLSTLLLAGMLAFHFYRPAVLQHWQGNDAQRRSGA